MLGSCIRRDPPCCSFYSLHSLVPAEDVGRAVQRAGCRLQVAVASWSWVVCGWWLVGLIGSSMCMDRGVGLGWLLGLMRRLLTEATKATEVTEATEATEATQAIAHWGYCRG